MIRKIILSVLFTLFTSTFAFASSATLSINKEKVDINDPISAQISIQTDWWWDLEVKKIKWLENFNVLWKSQSQSSSSQIQIINWKTESKTSVNYILNLSLSAKNNWDFELWPAIISIWWKEIKTNVQKISVSWAKIMMNSNSWIQQNTASKNPSLQKINSQNTVQKNISNSNNSKNNFSPKKEKTKIEDFESTEKKEIKENNLLPLFLWILILFWWVWYLYFKNNPEELKKFFDNKKFDKNLENKGEKFLEKEKNNSNDDLIDFEEEKIEELPDLNDEKFLEKINEIFLKKISKKFQIKNIFSKTNNEILEKISDSEKENIKNIFDIITKAKYSDIISDKSKIYDLVKNFN